MRKYLAAVAAVFALGALTAGGALADKGGVPNDNACHGQINAFANSLGLTPAELAALLGFPNAGDWNKFVKWYCG